MKLNKTPEFERVTEDIRAKADAARLSNIWHAFSNDECAAWVRPLMAVGHSNGTASQILGITLGQVAGVRNRKNIPSRNPARGGHKPKESRNVAKLGNRRKKK